MQLHLHKEFCSIKAHINYNVHSKGMKLKIQVNQPDKIQ